tara:strand:- start:189 stop:794 length:606 start_codon:yes stop_codon:yes gene_type:complete
MTLKHFKKKISLFLLFIFFLSSLTQCGLYRKTDSRKIPVNSKERVAKNVEEGRRIKFGNLGSNGSGKFEFASSNEMWRATIDTLDFVPLNNADYGGGIIITDWYNNSDKNNTSIKIMVQFLSNEIRADGIKVVVYDRICRVLNGSNNCKTQINNGEVSEKIKMAILKKAATFKNINLDKEVQEYRKKNKARPRVKKSNSAG